MTSTVLALISIAISSFGAIIGWKAYKLTLEDHKHE